MPQFYLPAEAKTGEEFSLKGPEAFHISKVLRCREGESLELFDGRGGRYKGTIVRIGKGVVEGRITETLAAPRAGARVRLNLYQALLKGQRWEWLLEKAVELGVSCFVPMMTQHAVVILKEDDRVSSKMEHWRKVIMAAAKQSGRADLPVIRPPVHLRDALAEAEKTGPIFFAWEKMAGSVARETLRDALEYPSGPERGPVTVNLFIGSEGGFADEEVELAEIHGAKLFGLGPRVLRGETAALAAASILLYELGAI